LADGSSTNSTFIFSLSDAITDADGNNLDGEWTNPASVNTVNSSVSTFPSGDGLSGGRFNFVMTLLPGKDLSPSPHHSPQSGRTYVPTLERGNEAETGCSSWPTALTKISSASYCVR